MKPVLPFALMAIFLGCDSPTPMPQAAPKRTLIKPPWVISNSNIQVKHIPPVPIYPPAAKEKRLSGDVTLQVTIDAKGVPMDVKALDGPEELTPTALAFLRGFIFAAKSGELPPTTVFQFIMPFRLR